MCVLKNTAERQTAEKELFALKDEVLRFLKKKYYWNAHDALTLYHDACLLILEQVERNDINIIKRSYVYQVCKNLGANVYRKRITDQKRFSLFFKDTLERYETNFQNRIGLSLFDTEDETISRATKALRAFSLLDEKCQKLIHFKYVSDYSHQMITNEMTQISTPSSSKTILGRCIKYWKKLNQQVA